jgi:hypothetical protein
MLVVMLFVSSLPSLSIADSISGPGGTKTYYYDDLTETGLLNFTDGETWTLSITEINVSQIAGNKILNFYAQDRCGYETFIPLQVQADFSGPGGHLLRSYDKGQILKSSQSFCVGQITGKFDLRVLIEDIGSNYYVTPQFRLPGASWQTFSGGSWTSTNYELTNVVLSMQLDWGADGTVTYLGPTVYSNCTWYVDSAGKIQESIDEASPASSIVVFGGTHLESLYINKSLTIRSTKMATVRGSGTHASSYRDNPLSRSAVVFVVNCTNVFLKGLDIEGEGLGPGNNNGVMFIYSSGEIENCTISPNTISDMSSRAIEVRGSNLTIAENKIMNFGRTGVYFGNSTGRLSNSTVIGQLYSAIDKVSIGVEVDVVDGVYRQGPSIVQIDGNDISNCDNTFQPGPIYPSCGVLVDYQRRTNEEASSTVLMDRNSLRNNYAGLELVSNPKSGAHFNSIFNNRCGIVVEADVFGNNWTLNARCNWWGKATGPSHSSNTGGTGDKVSDFVEYSPWLNDTYEVTPRIYHVNPTGTIQEAVVWAGTGDGISVHSGIYDEQVVINKSLTVQGCGNATIIRPSFAAKLSKTFSAPWSTTTRRVAPIVAANVSNGECVQIKNLRIDGSNIGTVPSSADFVAGVLYLETAGAIEVVDVANIIQVGSDYGSGIYLGSKINSVSIEVSGSTIRNFRRNGIETSAGMVPGRLSVSACNNTIIGRGPLGAGEPAQCGILITNNSLGTVNSNNIKDLEYTAPAYVATGILFLNAEGIASGNLLTNVQNGIGAAAWIPGAWTLSFNNNTISNSSFAGINAQTRDSSASLTLLLENNQLLGGAGDGVYIGLPPNYDPVGKINASIDHNWIAGWENGVYVASSVAKGSLITGNTISNNGGSGVLIGSGVNASNLIVDYNDFFGNTGFGVFNNGTNILDARSNWWGAESGPYHPVLNPCGTGNRVSDNVLFEPFLTQEPDRPVVQVIPPLSTVGIGTYFNVNVTITKASLMNGWQLRLYYKRAFLNCTAAVEGPFLNESSPGSTIFSGQINNAYNSTHGRISAYCAIFGSATASGSGVLATITFKAMSGGLTSLNLADTILSDQNSQLIPHTVIDGSVRVPGFYDIAVIRVSTSKTGCKPIPTVGLQYSFWVNFTVENGGDLSATFYVSICANSILLGTTMVPNLLPGARYNGSLLVSTVGLAFGNYTIEAQTSVIPNDIDPGNNVLTDGWIVVTIPGDVDGNYRVDIIDVVKITCAYSAKRADLNYSPNSDLDDNGEISILDVVICTSHYGQKYP